jgi:hypothetical protein
MTEVLFSTFINIFEGKQKGKSRNKGKQKAITRLERDILNN